MKDVKDSRLNVLRLLMIRTSKIPRSDLSSLMHDNYDHYKEFLVGHSPNYSAAIETLEELYGLEQDHKVDTLLNVES